MLDLLENVEPQDSARRGHERPIDHFPTRRELRARESVTALKSSSSRTRVASASRPRVARTMRTSSSAPRRKSRILPKLVSISAMLGAGALLVATSLPAGALRVNAADAVTPTTTVTSSATGAQRLAVSPAVVDVVPGRDPYTVVNLVAQAKMTTANQSFLYTNDVNGTIQWPFPDPVPVSSGFGARHVANCGFCSTFHEGLDFVPGAGTTIDSIADGIVSQADMTGPYGNHVIIDHVINGQKVQTLYAHMMAGSIKVTVGQTVTVAQPIGQVGSTGNSTGPHLHFEVHLDGTPVDPFAWLKANAN